MCFLLRPLCPFVRIVSVYLITLYLLFICDVNVCVEIDPYKHIIYIWFCFRSRVWQAAVRKQSLVQMSVFPMALVLRGPNGNAHFYLWLLMLIATGNRGVSSDSNVVSPTFENLFSVH